MDDEARLLALMRYEEGAERLSDFIPRISPRLPPPYHLKPLIDLWQRTRTEQVLAVVELPPRHAKTTTCTHGFAWRIMLDPSLNHAYITYADALSLSKSRATRRLSVEAGAEVVSTNVHHWELAQGGSFLATGVGGPLTGKGINGVAVVDDPHKNRKEAESRIIRDGVWEWFTDTFWTRLEDDASVILVQTRWHRDDLAGRVLKGFEDPDTGKTIHFEEIRLPALAEEDDPLGRQEGEALWPARFPEKKLKGIRSIIGPYGFASLYQQRPVAKGTQLFGDYPSRFKMDEFKLDGHRAIIVCDPATTEKTSADHTVIGVVAAKGYGEDMEAWILDWYRGQWETPAVVRMLKHCQTQWWGVAIAVEAVGGFKAVPQTLKAEDPTLKIMEISPQGDKWQRAQNGASAWNEGRYHIPVDREWSKELIAEASDFTPAASMDDQVDTLSHAWNTLYKAAPPRKRGVKRSEMPFG